MSALAIQNPHDLITESLLEVLPSSARTEAANDDEQLNILLVDDDDVAVEWVTRCLNKYNVNFNIEVADDGQSALDILMKKHAANEQNMPHFILLDLNMPGMNGFEFLKQVRSNPELASAVIFVLTTSDDNNDRAKAYNENIAGYLLKDATSIFNWLFSLLPRHTRLTNLLNTKYRLKDNKGNE